MILAGFGRTALFRALTPKYASSPLSGAGAAVQGGRFNRKGIEALYLSLDAQTALAEYQQTSPLLEPCTLAAYLATLAHVVDLRAFDGGDAWDPLWADWNSDWRRFAFDLHIEAPTWVLGDLVRDAGHAGIVFPSLTRHGGTNIVVYPDLFAAGDSMAVHDPNHKLPLDASSWT